MLPTPPDLVDCKNCGAGVLHAHCAHCGQPRGVARITLRGLVSDLVEQVTELDRGFLFTIKQLTLRPGHAIREYLAGRRKAHVRPLQFYLVMVGVYFLINQLLGVDPIKLGSNVSREISGGPESARQAAISAKILPVASEYLRFFLTIQTALLALVLRRLYRKSGYLLIETLVFALFVGGYHYFFSILSSLLSRLLSAQTTQFSFVGLALTITYTVWAITQFFAGTKSRGWQIAKAIGAQLLVYGLFIVLTALLAIAYIFFVLKPGA